MAEGLRTNQTKALAALLANNTIAEAAAAADIGERTLYRWLAEDLKFKQALNEAQTSLITQAAAQLMGLIGTAVQTLADLLGSDQDSVRRLAAVNLLDQAWKALELQNLTERLDALEAAINDN